MRLHEEVAKALVCNITHSDCPAGFWLLTVHCIRDIRLRCHGALRARSCTSPLRIIVSPRKPGKMLPYHPIVRGLFAMIPHQFYYQLVVLGLLWLCVMLHLAWPSRDVTTQTKPAK